MQSCAEEFALETQSLLFTIMRELQPSTSKSRIVAYIDYIKKLFWRIDRRIALFFALALFRVAVSRTRFPDFATAEIAKLFANLTMLYLAFRIGRSFDALKLQSLCKTRRTVSTAPPSSSFSANSNEGAKPSAAIISNQLGPSISTDPDIDSVRRILDPRTSNAAKKKRRKVGENVEEADRESQAQNVVEENTGLGDGKTENYKMVLLVRTDLGMGKGKIAAQVRIKLDV